MQTRSAKEGERYKGLLGEAVAMDERYREGDTHKWGPVNAQQNGDEH